jgi:hypothetical protein
VCPRAPVSVNVVPKTKCEAEEDNKELHLDVVVDLHNDRNASFVKYKINEYEDEENGGSKRSMRSNQDDYADDTGYGMDTSHNTGVSAGDDDDSWLASQNVS